MQILLTNDDGIYARGLAALFHRLVRHHHVEVIAPEYELSAVGHGITLNQPLRASKISVNGAFSGYAVRGTPADCIKLGLLELLSVKPDMVISGINPGANVGGNLNYSGTVAAAKEAAINGILALAVSVDGKNAEAFEGIADVVEKLARLMLRKGLPPGTFLNVNFPGPLPEGNKGIMITRQGADLFCDYFVKRMDPRNQPYYWQGCDHLNADGRSDIDGCALGRQFISITPIQCDMTDYRVLEDLKGWKLADELGKGKK